MAETTADVRRDIELTRERMSDTLAELEKRLNAMEMVRQHPWPAIALAAGAGFVLSGTRADVKAAAATATLAHGAGQRASRIGPMFDALLARRGLRLLDPANLAPGQTVAMLKEDTEWLKRRMTSGATSS